MKLPKGWINTELGKVCKLKNGFAFKSTEYKEYGVPVVRISDINNEIISVVNSVKVNERDIYENYLVEKDDILIAMSGATTGKFGIYKDSEKAYQNQRVGNFKILNKDLLCNNFLFYCIYNLKRQIEKDAYGGAQPNISSTKIENLEIPLPPLSEQHRIVAKIEELFSELDNGIEQLKKAKQQIKTYRQAVLKAAFEGKLTNKNVIDGELPEGWELSKIKDCLFLKKDKHKPEKTQKLFYIGLEHI
ncbi:MAG: restriction endonuclease subunit S, partial [Thermotogota bacterium]|nr:restriction endonuclease subunit S [Thermotogota bacterium]